MSSFDAYPERLDPGAGNTARSPVIGLTGAIGGGKSRFAALLGQRGAALIDADSIGHEVLEEPEITAADRCSDSAPACAPIVRKPRRIGESIARFWARSSFPTRRHGTIWKRSFIPRWSVDLRLAIQRETERGHALAIVLDAAILFEAGWDQLCDLVVFVDASFSVRLDRVARDRGWTDRGSACSRGRSVAGRRRRRSGPVSEFATMRALRLSSRTPIS